MSQTAGSGDEVRKAGANPKRGGGCFDGHDSVSKRPRTADEASGSDNAEVKKEKQFSIEADAAEDKGSRHSMEDAWVVLLGAGSPGKLRCAHFAVYDGHGGRLSAEHAQKNLHSNVLSAGLPRELMDVKAAKKAILDGFKKTDETLLQESTSGGWQDGATAVCVWVLGNTVFVANIGDAKAVLARSTVDDGESHMKAIVLTREHKAIYPQERARIQKAGGSVSSNGRLQGRLEVSRAFGDRQFKKVGVIATPDIHSFNLTGREHFIILGCDGLWGVFGPSDAVEFVHKLLKEGLTVAAVSRRLVKEAVRERRCKDNCTAIVITFTAKQSLALNIGVSKVVFPVYRNIIALLFLGPAAYFLEKNERPPLTFSLLVQFFLLALLGITANQGFYFLGLYYASPTFASAMQNSVPAITFLMASVLRLEQVHITRRDGLAKVAGTIASVGGATIMTLFQGPLLHQNQARGNTGEEIDITKSQNWTLGCVYLVGHCLSWAGWMVLQAPVLKKYPAKLTFTSFSCFFGLLQFLVIAAFMETDFEHWKIQSAEEILTILYAGIVASGVVISIQTWCIHKGGPVFVAIFQPVQTVLVAAMAIIIFGDHLYSGRILGAILITIGLYAVLWGKSREKILEDQEKQGTLTKHLLEDEKTSREKGNGPLPLDIP
ncbi:hypothetical protein SAY86_014724 [Trapa natans]|uniref:PPM-type phosphatase domain-containing protein n=1 Tax=Trapa natans TaxID=22666 RepID=A0AAN7KLP9_TRANT|nr:hypothetical protein SAY86_014724 [Trapa natans]